MPAAVTLELDRRFQKVAKGVYEQYNFDVGILKDSVHKQAQSAKRGLKTIAGGPARKTSQIPDGTTSQISEELRSKFGNFYTKPFRAKKNAEILRFTKSFFDLVQGRSVKKRCENLLQAIVRNPITRGDYGSNKELTAKIKGFNRLMIDTGQFFKAITAKVRMRRVSK